MTSLLLHPEEAGWAPQDQAAFIGLLADIGLIDTLTDTGNTNTFRLGRQFTALVMFLGCSPQILIDPQDTGEGQPVCSLRCHRYPEIRFLCAGRLPAVRCPRCRAPASGVMSAAFDKVFMCPQCGRDCEVYKLDWRQSAGFGRYFLEFTGVYPHEAVPSDRLMQSLSSCSGCAWRYFYAG